MAAPNPRHSMELLQPQVDSLAAAIAALTSSQWEAKSNCAGWQVSDLVSHVTRVGESIMLATERAISGEDTPAFGPTMAARGEEIEASGPAACAVLLREEQAEFVTLIGDLSDAQLDSLTFPHPIGPRNLSWYCSQKLSEVAFHSWDLRRSFGDKAPLEAGLAQHLLGHLLNPERPLLARKPLEGDPLTFVLSDGTSSWTTRFTTEGPSVQAGATAPGAPLIQAPPGWLALAFYGRVRVDSPEFTVSGNGDIAALFASRFGEPT